MPKPPKFIPGLLPPKPTDRKFLAAPLATSTTYVVPALVDLRPQLLTSSNQGFTPKCAAYAMAGWIEYYNWKYRGIAEQIDPNPIYARAKEIDEAPGIDGTTLDAVLKAAEDLQLISQVNSTSIRYVNTAEAQQALHRYGVILSAFTVTDKWSYATNDGWIPGGGSEIGGHAVVLCGYSNVNKPPWYAIQNSWGQQGWQGFNRLTPATFTDQFNFGLVWDFAGR